MRSRGFTLIELLVVVSVISLLSSIVLTNLNQARAKSNYSQIFSQLRQIRFAVETYYNDFGTYPGDAGPGSMPSGLTPYLRIWPTPPCPNLNYDWNYHSSGANVNIDVRTTTPSASVYWYCVHNAPGTACGTGTSNFESISNKQISC